MPVKTADAAAATMGAASKPARMMRYPFSSHPLVAAPRLSHPPLENWERESAVEMRLGVPTDVPTFSN